MKKAGILVLACVAVLCMAGCGFEEGAGATVTIVHDTPTPIPTPTILNIIHKRLPSTNA